MKTSYCNAEVGRRACSPVFWFPDDNLSLLRPIDTKLEVWVADVKRQLGIATQVSVVNVKVTLAKNRKSDSAL